MNHDTSESPGRVVRPLQPVPLVECCEVVRAVGGDAGGSGRIDDLRFPGTA